MEKLDLPKQMCGEDAVPMEASTQTFACVAPIGEETSYCPGQAPSVAQAKDVVLDWLETHGGEIRLVGPESNLAALSDGVAWGQRFHGVCGRLLPFLYQFGRFCPTDASRIIDIPLE